jgi:hypothetical protein
LKLASPGMKTALAASVASKAPKGESVMKQYVAFSKNCLLSRSLSRPLLVVDDVT